MYESSNQLYKKVLISFSEGTYFNGVKNGKFYEQHYHSDTVAYTYEGNYVMNFKEGWGKFEAVSWVYTNGYATKEELLRTSSCLSDSHSKNCGHCVCLASAFEFFSPIYSSY